MFELVLLIKERSRWTASVEWATLDLTKLYQTWVGFSCPHQLTHHISKVLLIQRIALEAQVAYDLNMW